MTAATAASRCPACSAASPSTIRSPSTACPPSATVCVIFRPAQRSAAAPIWYAPERAHKPNKRHCQKVPACSIIWLPLSLTCWKTDHVRVHGPACHPVLPAAVHQRRALGHPHDPDRRLPAVPAAFQAGAAVLVPSGCLAGQNGGRHQLPGDRSGEHPGPARCDPRQPPEHLGNLLPATGIRTPDPADQEG